MTTRVNVDGDRGGDCQGSEELPWTVSYGVPRSPKEFFIDSVKAPHPLELLAAVPDDLRQAVVNILQLGKSGWAAKMKRLVSSWAEEVGKLQEEEAGIHKDLHPDVEIVVGKKHLSLFEKMLASIDYLDHKVAKLMKEGFPLVGDLDVTGVFGTRMPEDTVRGADLELLLDQPEEIQDCVEEQVAGKTQ